MDKKTFPLAKFRGRSRSAKIVAGSIPTDCGLQDPVFPIETKTPVVFEFHETVFFRREQAGYVFLSYAQLLFVERPYFGATN
jgi:hypothetical protein